MALHELKKCVLDEETKHASLEQEIEELKQQLEEKQASQDHDAAKAMDIEIAEKELLKLDNQIANLKKSGFKGQDVADSKSELNSAEHENERRDLEGQVSSMREELTKSKRTGWKEKELQEQEIQKLEEAAQNQIKRPKKKG